MSSDKVLEIVTLILADGTRCTYSGPKQLPDVEASEMKIVGIEAGHRPLPEGCSFERTAKE